MKFYQIFKEELTRILLKLLTNYRKQCFQIHFQGQCHPNTKIRQQYHTKKENYRPVSLYSCKNSQQNICNIQQHIKKIIHHDHVGFILGMQGWFNIHKSINVKHSINKLKNKNHLNECRNKVQHLYMI